MTIAAGSRRRKINQVMKMEIDGSSVATGIIAVIIILAGFALIISLVIICALIVEWLFGLLNINIDHMIYWTGTALIILFATFCKPSSKKE